MMENYPVNSGNRYPGGRPFEEQENTLYFGRQKDINNLIDLILIKPIVVLFGKSGYGKSSLINAGVIPNLRKREDIYYVPFLIRFNLHSGTRGIKNYRPAETVEMTLAEGLKNVRHPDFDKIEADRKSFWYWIKLRQLTEKKNSRIRFVLLFDQFEELFTYPKVDKDDFSKKLAQLLYEPIPLDFLVGLKSAKETQTFDPEFSGLFHQKLDVSVVFSIRSDRMSQMNILADRHPSILKTCYELDALSAEDARSAIVEPAKLTGDFNTPAFKYKKSAIGAMLKDVTNAQDGKIEATTLQILCRYIEYTLVVQENQTLSKADLGNITDVFREYYESILKGFNEEEKQSAVLLLEQKMVHGERRYIITEDYIINEFKVSKEVLEVLERSSLIKKERDSTHDLYLYEVSHDTIVKAVIKVAEKRRKAAEDKRAEEEEKRKDEEIASEKRAKEEEEKKNQILQLSLTKERKAKRQLRFLIVIIGILLVVAIISYAMLKHSLNVEKALQQQKDEALIKVKKLNKERSLNDAKKLMEYGDNFSTNSHYDGYALTTYQEALDSIKHFQSEKIYIQLKKKIRDLEQKLNRSKSKP